MTTWTDPGLLVKVRVRVEASTVTAGDGELRRLDMPWLFMLPLRMGDAGGTSAVLAGLVERVAAGRLKTLIHARFPLDHIGDAHARNDAGDKVGHIVVGGAPPPLSDAQKR